MRRGLEVTSQRQPATSSRRLHKRERISEYTHAHTGQNARRGRRTRGQQEIGERERAVVDAKPASQEES